MWNQFLRRLIVERYQQLNEKNPSFSSRAFARRLGFSPGGYSEFISGKRRLSQKRAEKIAAALGLNEKEKQELERCFKAERVILQESQFDLIRDWHHYAVLSLFELKHPPRSPEAIAKRLNIPVERALESLERLENLGMLARDDRGQLVSTGESYGSPDKIPSKVVRASHKDGLELATRALEEVPFDRRDFTSMTFSASEKNFAQVRDEIREFRTRIYHLMNSSDKTDVYRLSIQLFALTNEEEDST